jgi:hypothetical protein
MRLGNVRHTRHRGESTEERQREDHESLHLTHLPLSLLTRAARNYPDTRSIELGQKGARCVSTKLQRRGNAFTGQIRRRPGSPDGSPDEPTASQSTETSQRRVASTPPSGRRMLDEGGARHRGADRRGHSRRRSWKRAIKARHLLRRPTADAVFGGSPPLKDACHAPAAQDNASVTDRPRRRLR